MIGRHIEFADQTFVVVGVTDRNTFALRPVAHGSVVELSQLQLRALGVDAPHPKTLRDETVEDIELLDPSLSTERLVYRLFHERGVRVFRDVPIDAQCSCSRATVETMLKSFPQDDRDHMVENGVITVTCEFCSSTYVFEPDSVVPDQDATPVS